MCSYMGAKDMCASMPGSKQSAEFNLVFFFLQFFFFLLIIFAIEVAAGIWGFSNQSQVTFQQIITLTIRLKTLYTDLVHYRNPCEKTLPDQKNTNQIQKSESSKGIWRFICLCDIYCIIVSRFTAVLQVVNDITGFYTQTYNNYKSSGDEHLKETLRVIQTEVSLFLIQADCDLIQKKFVTYGRVR